MTYRDLNRSEKGWIASHVASDLLMMNNPNDEVDDVDMAKIEDARKRDAAMASSAVDAAVVQTPRVS